MFKKILIILAIIIISGLSGILADRYCFPHLAATKLFQSNQWLKKTTENVTVINKTEQVYVKEESSVVRVTGSVASSMVNIISYTDNKSAINKVLPSVPLAKNGSGMIVTSDGIIMTYASAIVIDNAQYKVMVDENSLHDAQLLGIDSYSNLAFLKINASNLPVVSFGNSDEFKAGEKVIAIGNSLGKYQNRFSSVLLNDFNPTFNLSGKTLSSSDKLEGVFEANFPAQDQYVGGPIVNYSGQVIGIVGSIQKDNQTFYFQIPTNKARIVLEKAIRKELDQVPSLGIYYVPLTKTFAAAHNMDEEKGALIYSPSGQQGLAMIANSPGAKAGLKINDVVTAVSGEMVTLEKTLSDLIYKYKKGEEIELTVLRGGEEMTIKVQL